MSQEIKSPSPLGPPKPINTSRPGTRTHRVYTLVELLVSIGIIALLIAIIIPALAGTKQLASQLTSAANLRSIGQLTEIYTQSNADAYPWGYAGTNSCGVPTGFAPIWNMSSQWTLIMANTVGQEALKDIALAPSANRESAPCTEPPSYTYSHSFLADAETWSGTAKPTNKDDSDDPAARLLGGIEVHDVLSPSAKVIMWEWELPYLTRVPRTRGPDLDEQTPILFTDGHAETHKPADASPAVPNPFTDSDDPTARLHNTADGVRGRDYESS